MIRHMEEVGTPETTRRTTRAALAEIPAPMDRLRITPLRALTNITELSPNLPSGYLSPAPSPDELVIQQRGRRRIPTTWSPDIELKRNSFHSTIRTPPKNNPNQHSPYKHGLNLRSTPRKRLLMGETERIPLSPEKIDFSDMSTPQKLKLRSPIKAPTPMKRMRLDKKLEFDNYNSLDSALKGLSPSQLIGMIKNIVDRHPDIETEIKNEMPAPDLAPLEEKLKYLKTNIYNSLPSSRLTSKTDSPAFSRVKTHLAAFKKCVLDQGKTLVESQHWSSILQYVSMAWGYVRATPVWDNTPHNAQRKQCFKALMAFCMTALKKGNLDAKTLAEFEGKLRNMLMDSDDVQPCLKYIHGLKN
ncbi:Tethering factor for nuclear proteasome sts1 [Eumeta japonica]|uniref:Tethering factor for nuclear proteasome sts1 n=1 Tax=Eumeta variegata TaxID=151549 RepID=A0A4C1W088_EUMVA|nr:Tethering factor for nuclear proteasome sts1 [Eumeta japonica]